MSTARRLNDGMGAYVANETIKCMNKKGVLVKDANILLLGITFKENCPDIRNTKMIDVYHSLEEFTSNITVYDPWANVAEVKTYLNIDIFNKNIESLKGSFDAVILGVAHNEFRKIDIRSLLCRKNGVVYDVKGVLPKEKIDARL